MQNSPNPDFPRKSILKTSLKFERSGSSLKRSAKFDELNVRQTFHPIDKDYGHMKIDEPQTPYNYEEGFDDNDHALDTDLLVEKLRLAQLSSQSFEDETAEDAIQETEEKRKRRLAFEHRRKEHYREFEAAKLARKHIQDLNDDDDEADSIVPANIMESNPSEPKNITSSASEVASVSNSNMEGNQRIS